VNTFARTLSAVFDKGAETAQIDGSTVRLTRADEAAAIADVVAGGHEGLPALLLAYAPALRGAVGRYRATLDREEAQAVACAAVVEACHAVRPGDYLAGVLVDYLTDALATAAGGHAPVSIPTRTLKRFLGILRRADGDFARAALIAPEHSMSREAFHAIAEALSAWGSLDETPAADEDATEPRADARPLWDDSDAFADAEDRILCEVAFSSVSDLETDVCRAAYGFSSYRPKSDAEIAGDFGLSRPTVQRTRTGALVKMRAALAVDAA
jgi:hypothetical protein